MEMRSRTPISAPNLFPLVLGVAVLLGASVHGAPPQQPPRDAPAQQPGTIAERPGLISGRVLDAASGRPMVRALVRITAPELPGGRVVLTDDNGAFRFGELPSGRYTVTASKTGFVALTYGQRRPLQPGTPLQLAAGQSLTGVDLILPRGSVVSGVVTDELGNPLPGATVRVERYQHADGARRLIRAGSAQTDDRGYYRVWGLNPGQYYVSAVMRNPDLRRRGGALDESEPPEAYAPTYYPGVPSPQEAQPVTVGLGAEAEQVTFAALLVRTSLVTGRLQDADPSPQPRGNVTLVPDGPVGRGPLGPSYGGRIGRDGTFTIENVPPGRYLLRAVGGNGGNRQFGALPLTLTGGEVHDLVVVLTPGATLTGTMTLAAAGERELPDLDDFSIAARPVEPGGPAAADEAADDGTFALRGIQPGLHWIRAQAPRGWMLRSVVVDGRETIDTPLELRGGQTVGDVRIVFTDRLSELNGTLLDSRGQPVTEYTVLAFSSDPGLWRPESRHIATARPDQNGRYQIRGLPEGDYLVAVVDPAEPGEWLEPSFLDNQRDRAVRVAIREGEVKAQDLRVSEP
jgi:protocatechuate 3,4-dioxygenase beta subunit